MLAQVAIIADCHALQVGEIHVEAGESRVFQNFQAAAALVFHDGTGAITIAGASHAIGAGTVELVCPGETCVISAVQRLHAFLIVPKDKDGRS